MNKVLAYLVRKADALDKALGVRALLRADQKISEIFEFISPDAPKGLAVVSFDGKPCIMVTSDLLTQDEIKDWQQLRDAIAEASASSKTGSTTYSMPSPTTKSNVPTLPTDEDLARIAHYADGTWAKWLNSQDVAVLGKLVAYVKAVKHQELT